MNVSSLRQTMDVPKKNITNRLWIKKKVYFCRLFEVECVCGWKCRV